MVLELQMAMMTVLHYARLEKPHPPVRVIAGALARLQNIE